MFDKRTTLFPSKEKCCFLSHCSISPLYEGAASAAAGFQRSMVEGGITSLTDFADLLPRFRKGYATLLKSSEENISFVHSTAEALCQIANGYPFKPGDQIISYIHEYPSNHYPWLIQERRGVELVLLPDVSKAAGFERSGRPGGWSMADLEQLCTTKTKVVALSHVQFTSGYAADLKALGSFCRERHIDLIVDCAQSLGCLPIYPDAYGISAVAASGWKWLMGPKGAAVLYTRQSLRDKLNLTMAGPGMMRQMHDYLDHSWNPFHDGRLFEYSTIPWDHVAAFTVIAEDLFNRYAIESIREEVFRLQDLFLQKLDRELFEIQYFELKNRSGIISISPKRNTALLLKALSKENIVVTERGGYVRLAPHFYLDDNQLMRAAETFNRLGGH
ncbi:MAG: aminotransferase class V-fold PLP-dependent enzyme [Desulfobacterales bacterium]|nr:aminotransferase class V-fold PLP-dependent enzyme [Desulfobacterales bacterium]